MKVQSITSWTASQVERIVMLPGHVAPPIGKDDFTRIVPDLDIWDAWPVQDRAGHPFGFDGAQMWMALAAPHNPDPDVRHGLARIHLFVRTASGWTHRGAAMPEGFSPGSREWSGSAVVDPDGLNMTLYFTAAGTRGEPQTTYLQRIFSARATVTRAGNDELPGLSNWRDLAEIVQLDRAWYMPTDEGSGTIGTIKAFRDPAFFRDPLTGDQYLYFAGSAARSTSQYNGVVGVARAILGDGGRWELQPPIISADGLNNELERPHVVYHGGKYYLFWSTQSHVFDPAGPVGPTGLYGMVADTLDGAWKPLNETCLVFANPPAAPSQAYSWLVLPDLTVISFVDNWGEGRDAASRRFGATFAPLLSLELDDDIARLAD